MRRTLLTAMVLVVASPAWSGIKKGDRVITLNSGTASSFSQSVDLTPFGGGFDRASNTGGHAAAVYFRQMGDHFGLGWELGLGAGEPREHVLPAGKFTTNTEYITLMIMGRYVFMPEKQFYPYLLGGIGRNTYILTIDGRPEGAFTWADNGTREHRTVTTRSSGLALTAGAGYEGVLHEVFLCGIEVRWHHLRTNPGIFVRTNQNIVNVMTRIGWKFGPHKKKKA